MSILIVRFGRRGDVVPEPGYARKLSGNPASLTGPVVPAHQRAQ